MAKNTNTFEKRRREVERMRKAQEKRERRLARRSASADPESHTPPSTVLDGE